MELLKHKLLAMADDELILAHRNSEWIGHAPILEEDIAIANMAQDELGHAKVWLDLYCQLTEEDPDQLVFFREAADYRNAQLLELPRGDWAFTMLRQYLFDAYELVLLDALQHSTYEPLAQAVAKVRNEEIYHYRHSAAWVTRLGLGTAESHQRLQTALDESWPYTDQLFAPVADERLLASEGMLPAPADVRRAWVAQVLPHLQGANLHIPGRGQFHPPRTEHTPYLTELLADMQKVARFDPEAEW